IVLEMKGEPVQEFGMTWFLANAAEVLERFDNAGSKQLFPIPVYGDTGGQRLAGRKEPLGKSEPVRRLAVGQLRKYPGNIGREVSAYFVEKVSALEFPGGSSFVRLFFGHHRNVHGAHLGELPLEIFEAGHCRSAFGFHAEGRPAGIVAGGETNALDQS